MIMTVISQSLMKYHDVPVAYSIFLTKPDMVGLELEVGPDLKINGVIRRVNVQSTRVGIYKEANFRDMQALLAHMHDATFTKK